MMSTIIESAQSDVRTTICGEQIASTRLETVLSMDGKMKCVCLTLILWRTMAGKSTGSVHLVSWHNGLQVARCDRQKQ